MGVKFHGHTVKYWEGRSPPSEYFEPVDPYCDIGIRNQKAGLPIINHQELIRYMRETGKRATELSDDEVQAFAVDENDDDAFCEDLYNLLKSNAANERGG